MTDKDKKKKDYQFVPVPTNLLFVLDPDCLMAIALMIDKESYWESRNKVFNGYFTLSVQELAEYLRFQNKQDARLTLEALYRAGLIDVKAESGKRLGAKIKLNWDKIKSEDIDCVEKLPRGTKITYCPDTESTTGSTTVSTNCTPTLEKEIEKEIDIEKDIDIEIDTDIEEEPSAEETRTLTKNIENTTNPVEGYLQWFMKKYPSLNYSCSSDSFQITYNHQLIEFQTKIREELHYIPTIDFLAFLLQYYFKNGRVYDGEEGTIPA